MKKVFTLIIAAFIGTSVAMAGVKQSIQETISKQLIVPADVLKENYEKVTIDFKMKPDGEITLINVDSQNAELKKHVMNHFKEIDFSKAEKLDEGNYSINVFFKSM